MLFELLKPGIKVKRYILLLVVCILVCSYGIVFLGNNPDLSLPSMLMYVGIISVSLFVMILSFVFAQKSLITITLKQKGVVDKEINLADMLVSQKRLNEGPKIVVIGGGSGLSTMLRGLKQYSNNITAIVTMFDDGGSAGRLREELDILPPGDIRRCIVALSSAEPEMEKLIAYRFAEGSLKGHSFGNLLLAAMTETAGSFPEAIKMMGKILAVRGKVLPVTLDKLSLCAELEDGTTVNGETQIGTMVKEKNSPIKRMYLSNKDCEAAPGVIEALEKADIIVMGPGSLYTSIIPNLLVSGVSGSIIDSKAIKIYVCNIMNQSGETDNHSMAEYINNIEKYIGKSVLTHCIINNEEVTNYDKDVCSQKESVQVGIDIDNVSNKEVKYIFDKLVKIDYDEKKILHDTAKLANDIMTIWKDNKAKTKKLNIESQEETKKTNSNISKKAIKSNANIKIKTDKRTAIKKTENKK